VAPPVFKTGLAANDVAGGFDSLLPPPSFAAIAVNGGVPLVTDDRYSVGQCSIPAPTAHIFRLAYCGSPRCSICLPRLPPVNNRTIALGAASSPSTRSI
jgi:hypothetical protein